MSLKPVSAAASNPISLEEAKAHLRVDHNDENTLIDILIAAATQHAERFMARALIDQTWDLYLDAFPSEGEVDPDAIEIPLPPLIEVVGVFYLDSEGDEQQIDAADYVVVGAHGRENSRARIELGSSASWPTPRDSANSVRIRFRAGYQDVSVSPAVDDVPADIRCAILLILGSLYANREQVVVGVSVAELPWGAQQLMRLQRVDLSMA